MESPDAVRQCWHDAWAKLAECCYDDERYDIQHQRAVGDHINTDGTISDADLQASGVSAEQLDGAKGLNTPITLDEVIISVKSLQDGKATGCDGLPAELFKNGGDRMRECLHQLCRIMFTASEVPLDWLRGVIVPIHKDGDPTQPLNYRPITLLSVAGKVYTNILLARLEACSEKFGVLAPEQGGFRKRRGTAEQLFALTELIRIQQLRNKPLYVAFLDIRKAHDTTWHSGLKLKQQRVGIQGLMYRAICSLYAGCTSTVRLGGALGYTDFFGIDTGVRQGCLLSPWLYALFINDIATEIRQLKGAGVTLQLSPESIEELFLLMYADDIALMSETLESLQRQLTCASDFAHRWNFQFNQQKSATMCFKANTDTSELPKLLLSEVELSWTASYKYLGVELESGGTCLKFKAYRKRAVSRAHRAAMAISGLGMYSGKLPVPLAVQMYKALVRPLMEYAAEITTSRNWPEAETLQLALAKRMLQCKIRTPTEAVMGDLGLMQMDMRFMQLRLSL